MYKILFRHSVIHYCMGEKYNISDTYCFLQFVFESNRQRHVKERLKQMIRLTKSKQYNIRNIYTAIHKKCQLIHFL